MAQLHIYMAQPPLLLLPFAGFPLSPLCVPFYLLGTLLAVTGIVHLGLRLLVNWPHLPHPSPNSPPPSKFPEPQLPSASLRRPREYSGSCYPEHVFLVVKMMFKGQLHESYKGLFSVWTGLGLFRTMWSWGRDVVLERRTMDLGKPWEDGNLEWGRGGQFTSNLGPG